MNLAYMQISRNIVNGPKSNNWVLLGIRVIVCIQEPPHHLCRTFVHYACLRLCSAIVHFIRNNCLYFVCFEWLAHALISVKVSNFWGVWRIFARISPNFPEKLFCDFCLKNISHKDYEDLLRCDLHWKVFILLFCKRWEPFLPGFVGILPRYSGILPKISGILPRVSKNQNFESALAPSASPHPTPMHVLTALATLPISVAWWNCCTNSKTAVVNMEAFRCMIMSQQEKRKTICLLDFLQYI